jgi:glycosidase
MAAGENGSYQVAVDLPGGAWQFQVANGGQHYGADGGANSTPLWLAGPATVEFSFDAASHATQVAVQGPQGPTRASLESDQVVAPGLASQERFYFLVTDRFANGDTSNDRAYVADNRQPDQVSHSDDPAVSGFDPTRAGYYQGGDLRGVIEQLDYIAGLGVTALWLTPPFVNLPVSNGSAGYHGYWTTDFTHIDPHLGGDQAMIDLIEAAHAAGLKVFFDVVLNHTADTIAYQGVEGPAPYVSLTEQPYVDTGAQVFDPADYTSVTGGSFPQVDLTRLPYQPYRPDPAVWLVPDQLNDLTWYHNRGEANLSAQDESTQWGDFAGLDDLMTERPELAQLMVDQMARPWIAAGVDGFRFDTVKYVGLDFWASFTDGLRELAASDPDLGVFTFGEAYDTNIIDVVAPPMRQGGIDAMLDFPYAFAAQDFARGGIGQVLADLFDKDDYYTTEHGGAADLVTFLDNHDMGRLGYLIGADADDLQRRIELAYALTYLARGQPVVYYGDEQGLVGTGGDVGAREPLFPPVPGSYQGSAYQDSPVLGGTLGTSYAAEPYDTASRLYTFLADLGQLRQTHPALSQGAQVSLGASGPVYAFARVAGSAQTPPVENLVAVNSSTAPASITVTTMTPGATYSQYYPAGSTTRLIADQDGQVTVLVPGLSAVALEADRPVAPAGVTTDGYAVTVAQAGNDRGAVRATAPAGRWTQTSVYARLVGSDPTEAASWTFLGTDTGADPAVYVDLGRFPPGALVEYRAVTTDVTGATVAASAGGPAVLVGVVEPTPRGVWVLVGVVALAAVAVAAVVWWWVRRRRVIPAPTAL